MTWNFATSLIGSLPYDNAQRALDTVLDGRLSCPAWPQLPAFGYSESMYVQTGEHLPGIKIDDVNKRITFDQMYDPTDIYTAILTDDVDFFAPSEMYNRGLFELLTRDVSSFQGVKGQVTGPISEGLQIQSNDGRAAAYDETYSELIRRTVNMSAKWQVRELSKKNGNVIMFFDEPSLTLLGSPFASISSEDAVSWMNEAMDVPGCKKGIHCCGNTDWPMVLSTDVDVLSFDAYAYAHTLIMFSEEVNEFMERGGILSWGIVPSSDEGVEIETSENLISIMEGHINALAEKGLDKRMVVEQSMMTPQCGLGGMTVENVENVLSLLNDVSKGLKGRYGLE